MTPNSSQAALAGTPHPASKPARPGNSGFSALRSAFASLLIASASLQASDLGKWMEQMDATDRVLRREATYQLSIMGPAARPALSKLIVALDDPDKQVWSYAVTAIAAMGPDAAEAIPKLMEGMDSRKGRGFRPRDKAQTLFRCADALARIGPAARPELLSALKSEDTGLRIGAAKALGAMAAKEAIPALIENLGHGDEAVRSEAVEALGLIGEPAVAPLSESLGWPDARLREGSARALGSIGRAAAPVAPGLLEKLGTEKEISVQVAMLSALPRVGLPAAKSVPPLIAALKSDQEPLRHAAVNALLMIRPASTHAVPAVAALLKEPAITERAVYLLGRFGADAQSVVPELVAMAAKTGNPPATLTDALSQIGAPAIPTLLAQVEKVKPAQLDRNHWTMQVLRSIGISGLQELQDGLKSPNASVRLAALGIISELGFDAREARADVLKLAGDPDPQVRASFLGAAVALDASPQQTLEKLEAAMKDKEPVVRAAAADAAAALGKEAEPISAQVTTLLGDPESKVRVAALNAAAKLGSKDPQLATRLIACLDDPASRTPAARALAGLGSAQAVPSMLELYSKSEPDAKAAMLAVFPTAGNSALPVISEAMKDPAAAVRAAAVHAYAKVERNPDVLFPAVNPLLADAASEVRRAAAESLAPYCERHPDKAGPTMEAIIRMVAQESDRSFALDALRSMRVRDLKVIELALNSPAQDARSWGSERAGRLGAEARPLRPRLEELQRSSNDADRRGARRALEQVGK